jgi:hypothetical protein
LKEKFVCGPTQDRLDLDLAQKIGFSSDQRKRRFVGVFALNLIRAIASPHESIGTERITQSLDQWQ